MTEGRRQPPLFFFIDCNIIQNKEFAICIYWRKSIYLCTPI